MRYENWAEKLNTVLVTKHFEPFVWGKHDCCLFAADCILEMTGIDYAVDFRGCYKTVLEAARILKEKNGVRGVATLALGNEISYKLAQRGDIVLIETEEHGETLTVCVGVVCVAPGIERLEYVPMEKAICAWRVI